MSSQEKSLTLGGNEQQHADADAAASCRRKVSLPAQKLWLQSCRVAVSLSFTHRTSVSISQPPPRHRSVPTVSHVQCSQRRGNDDQPRRVQSTRDIETAENLIGRAVIGTIEDPIWRESFP
ncbi:uncharacterized protein [Arachis hypogaea]|uniref:uncharacterized protein isoform X1 n=1 Tax=Arachis hypogaea TaxID=3818 RepID=UPI003B222DD3